MSVSMSIWNASNGAQTLVNPIFTEYFRVQQSVMQFNKWRVFGADFLNIAVRVYSPQQNKFTEVIMQYLHLGASLKGTNLVHF